MKKIINHFLIASSLTLLMSSQAYAYNSAGTIPVTVGGGNYYFASKRHIENSGVPIVMLGYNFTDNWGIEGLLGVFNTTSRRISDSGKQVDGTLFAIDAVYHFPLYRNVVQPYVLAGPGVLGLSPNGEDANNEGNVNAAIGAQLFAGEKMAFRVEGRALYTIVGGKMDYFLNAGLTFFFAT